MLPESIDAPARTLSLSPADDRDRVRRLLPDAVLILILVVAAGLRFFGLNWDSHTHLHPDERFLTMVETGLRLPDSIEEYFDTATSPLNPHNAGFSFFVYGTLPVFLVRYLAEVTHMTGYDQVHLLGRAASATFDLFSVFLVFLIGSRLYRRRVGLLAAAFAATSVLMIQHAHFFVVDPFANTFILGGLYFAVRALDERRTSNYILFGLMVGMAAASKISAAPLAGVIVLVSLTRLARHSEDPSAALRYEIRGVLLAAIVSFVTFRVFQPYAFAGPSFLSFRLNPKWLDNLKELSRQINGEVDFPPALQWVARTPIVFPLVNLVRYGLGPALGILAWAGWGWALWQSLTGVWKRHLIPVLWTGAFFIWQSIGFTKTMRYLLPIYPTLAILAAWAVWEAWDWAHAAGSEQAQRRASIAVAALGGLITGATLVWAVAFTANYTRPMTRVAGSRWIYSHVPGAANLVFDSADQGLLEPVPIERTMILAPGRPFSTPISSDLEGEVTGVRLEVRGSLGNTQAIQGLQATLSERGGADLLGQSLPVSGFVNPQIDAPIDLRFVDPVPVSPGESFEIEISLSGDTALDLGDRIGVIYADGGDETVRDVSLPRTMIGLGPGVATQTSFEARASGQVSRILLPYVTTPAQASLVVSLFDGSDEEEAPIATARVTATGGGESSVEAYLDHPIGLKEGQTYTLDLGMMSGSWASMRGSTIISESSWDDGLPIPMDGWDGYGTLYSNVNQELYWADEQDDNADGVPDKQQRLVESFASGDYLIITSNRQYGAIPRVPARYPLTTAYYRALFDCPEPEYVPNCGADMKAGQGVDELGYELIASFEDDPRIGPIQFDDQYAEEAFTVYDHPKVMVFKKTDGFSAAAMTKLLGAVDVSHVVRADPKDQIQAQDQVSKTLLLPPDRLQEDQSGGTWSQLFNRMSLLNRSQVLAVMAWWVTIGVLGLLAFPLTREAFPGLRDEAYPVARIVGLLILAWGSWMIGSANIPVTRLSILSVVLLLLVCSAYMAWRDREALIEFFRSRRREIAWIELLALSFFLLDLFIRFGNPDLWHPSKGGEKPMDFSYLNAVIKSVTFPPFDPWFSGGYINYYYFGFVIVGMPIKLLGIDPSVAYNLVVPTIFALLALAAYAVGSNLVSRGRGLFDGYSPNPRVAGAAAAIMLVVIGNLGTARMIYDGFKQLGASDGQPPGGGVAGMIDAVRGLERFLTTDSSMPYGLDSWYWDPSRAIPPGEGEPGPITEFPFFTFLYADLHAHMINFPFTVLTLAWGLSWLLEASRGRPLRPPGLVATLVVGALAFGVLRPTNTWDFPVYWLLGFLAIAGAALIRRGGLRFSAILETILVATVLFGGALALFQPYTHWYAQGYNAVAFWEGGRTSVAAYLTVHGLFLFAIVSWLVVETIRWMAETPLSALNRLRPKLTSIITGLILYVVLIASLRFMGYAIAPLVFVLLGWVAVLFFRPGMPMIKRAVLVMTAAALALTFMVEVIVLKGDIGRMNTVFKFYLQVWMLFGLSAAAAFAWILADLPLWSPRVRNTWSTLAVVVVFSAALYPILATSAKIKDRMATDAPHTLDGAAYMPYAVRYELGQPIPLAEDYAGIRWMQDHIQGSPVIVEANLPPYQWGSRFTIYTGLPGVLGWDWHQRQQRLAAGDAQITEREDDISDFYLTQSPSEALAFLQKYDVSYVVVGRLERVEYATLSPCVAIDGGARVTCDMSGRSVGIRTPDMPASACEPLDSQNPDGQLTCPTHGLDKFEAMATSGELTRVFQDGETAIYEVAK
jgi:YYY domain-containing protein